MFFHKPLPLHTYSTFFNHFLLSVKVVKLHFNTIQNNTIGNHVLFKLHITHARKFMSEKSTLQKSC